MSEPDDTNTRDELCRRFRKDLAQPESQRFYSEDDLIDIFDYAGDLGDNYLRTESLLLGARLYPDSQDLRERRAIFYQYLDPVAFKEFIEDNPNIDSPLWQIMRLNLLRGDDGNKAAVLKSFLDNAGDLTDEEVIQFVQLAGSLAGADWILENLADMRKHVTYLPTLLYEVAAQAEDAGRYADAAKLVEELTDLEPYNADFWTMHASLNLMQNRPEDAAADLDYALAIDPENLEARRAKLGILTEEARFDDFDALVDSILAQNPDDAEVAVSGIDNARTAERVNQILDKISGSVTWNYELALRAARNGYEHLDLILNALVDEGYIESENWQILVKAAYETDNYPQVSTIMRVYHDRTGSDLDCAVYLYATLFRAQMYEVVAHMYLTTADSTQLSEGGNTIKATAMFIMSLLRLGQFEMARNFVEHIQSELEKVQPGPGDELHYYAMNHFIADVTARLSSPTPTDWAAYDPLHLDRK